MGSIPPRAWDPRRGRAGGRPVRPTASRVFGAQDAGPSRTRSGAIRITRISVDSSNWVDTGPGDAVNCVALPVTDRRRSPDWRPEWRRASQDGSTTRLEARSSRRDWHPPPESWGRFCVRSTLEKLARRRVGWVERPACMRRAGPKTERVGPAGPAWSVVWRNTRHSIPFRWDLGGEFDPGSGSTLAARLMHASRTGSASVGSRGGRARNTWATCPGAGGSPRKRGVIPRTLTGRWDW